MTDLVQPIEISGQQELVYLNEPTLRLHFRQQANSVLRLFLYTIPSANSDSHLSIHCEQMGDNCTTEIYSLAYLNGQSSCDMNALIEHQVGGGKSLQISRFVLNDQARASYAGEVVLAPNAQKVDAQQNNRNLLLSDECEMRVRPCLEIYADDVKASHGTSTGQLDEEALFYMQQRGIRTEQARQMLVQAFMAECIHPLTDEQQREHILQLISR